MCNSKSHPVYSPYTMIAGLQAEVHAAYKEGEAVKKKLKLQEAEMEALRSKHTEKEDNLTTTYSINVQLFCLRTVLLLYLFYYSWPATTVWWIIAKA